MTRKKSSTFRGPWLVSVVLLVLTLSVSMQFAMAQYQYELTPSISVSETYDDNIYLNPSDETSDYITAVTPGITLNVFSLNTQLQFAYFPSFVWYADEDQNNTVRHSGTFSLGTDLSRSFRLDLSNNYVFSENPIEQTEGVTGVRRTLDERYSYQRNTFDGSVRYLFGPENTLSLGYRNNLLVNEEYDAPFEALTPDDGMIQTPYGTLTYWFNSWNGMELNYDFVSANFDRKDDSEAGDDYTGHGAGIRYIRRFSPHTEVYLDYRLTTRDFDGVTENYNVHDGSVGFDHAFSPNTSISLAGGYFIQDNEDSDDVTGPTYNASLQKTFSRGTFTLDGAGGWNEAYLEAERRGVIRYWNISSSVDYQFLEWLTGYMGGSYQQNESDADDNDWSTWGGNVGLRWSLLRWLSASLDFTHQERDGDVDFDDYKVNRVSLLLTASALHRRARDVRREK